MNMREAIIQYMIWEKHNYTHVFPNIHTDVFGGSEVDALYLTGTRRAVFYEIKVSRSDFLADRRKKRHRLLTQRSLAIAIKPKQFWYVIHGFDVSDDEIPEYAGLMTVRRKRLAIVKKAPVLWDAPLSETDIWFLSKKIYARYCRLGHETGGDAFRQHYHEYFGDQDGA